MSASARQRPIESACMLAEVRRWHPQTPVADSEVERAGLARFVALYAHLRPDRVDSLVDDVYGVDVCFDDGLKTVRGLAHLRRYLVASAAAVADCRVVIDEITRSELGEHLLRWQMMIRFKRWARGRETWSQGLSHLRLDDEGRVVYQQDYWNAADGLYQYVPVLGAAIRAIQRRF